MNISAVLVTLNEEADIARALDSVAWCDEILVVDSGSTDRTVEICVAHGCKVIHRKFTGYGQQKAFAVSQAANDWVFVVDADEEVTPALRDEIRARLDSPEDCRAFRIPITTILWDQVVRNQDRHTAAKLRLFDRRYGTFQNQLVHESVALNGRTELLQERMYNHSYANIADYFDKFNRYTTAAAVQCFLEGKQSGVIGAIARLPITFCQMYFAKGYVLDGATGLVWSLFSSFYPAVKYLKLWELRRSLGWHAPSNPIATDIPKSNPQPAVAMIPIADIPLEETAPQTVARRKARNWRLIASVAAVFAVGLALLWMPLTGRDLPGDYSACLLFAILVTACFGKYRTALIATGLSIVALDYFILMPPEVFTMPDTEDLFRLALFLALSLLTISVVYRMRRHSSS